MKATYRQVINGKIYNVGDDLPDYGSVKFITNDNGIVEIECNSTDISKLPTWVKQGSSAVILDTGKVYKFDETNIEWAEFA